MESPKVCLDTDVLIDILANKKNTVDYVKQLENAATLLLTTSVNSFELYYGSYKTKRKDRNIEACKNLLRRLLVLDFTDTASLKAAAILNELESKGESLDFRDVFVASAAMLNDCTLATRNVSHFMRIPDLKVVQAP